MVCGVKIYHAICSLALGAVLGLGMNVPCAAQDDAAAEPAAETAEPKALSLGPESAKDKEAAKQLRAYQEARGAGYLRRVEG